MVVADATVILLIIGVPPIVIVPVAVAVSQEDAIFTE